MSAARVAACVLAWLLCLAPLTLPATRIGSSRFAACALIWAAILSLPISGAGDARGPAVTPHAAKVRPSAFMLALALLALALPQLSLALTLDGEFGGHRARDRMPALLALAMIGGLALAAELGARRGRSARTAHGLAWAVFVSGAPLLALALGWGGAGDPPHLLRRIAAASPLAWIASQPVHLAWGPALVTLVVLFASLAPARPAS